jgi:hypothetical protein
VREIIPALSVMRDTGQTCAAKGNKPNSGGGIGIPQRGEPEDTIL